MPDCNDVFKCDRIKWTEQGDILVGTCTCHRAGSVAQRPKPKTKPRKQTIKESNDGNS